MWMIVLPAIVFCVLILIILLDAALSDDVGRFYSDIPDEPPRTQKDMGRYERVLYENFCAMRGWNPLDPNSWKVWLNVRKEVMTGR